MLTQYLPPPGLKATCLHNTAQWQVTELMGGSACEILRKTRVVNEFDRGGRALHDCYPSLFLQGDEASEFLAELANAQSKLTQAQVDALVLDAYEHVMN